MIKNRENINHPQCAFFGKSTNNLVIFETYVVKATSGTRVIKAIVDKGSLYTTTTRNVDTVSTTAVIVTEKKIGATLGTLGDTANSAITSSTISGVNPLALESSINSAVGAVKTSAVNASQSNIDLVNLVNVVAATVFNDVNTAQFIAGTSPTSTISTTQFTVGSATSAVASVQQAAVSTNLTSTVAAYIPPPVGTFAITSKVKDGMVSTASYLPGVLVTTVGLTSNVTTYSDANGYFTLAGIPPNTSFTLKMSFAGYVDSYSAQLSLSANLDTSDRPYAIWMPAKLTTDWKNTSGTGVIRASVVDSTNLASGYIAGAVVTGTDATSGAVYPVVYLNNSTNNWDSTLTSTDVNGNWMFKNVPAGRTVYEVQRTVC